MPPEDSDFICAGWRWDATLRELSKYQRKGKGWEDQPEAVERLSPVRSVTWHQWSQAPMQSSTGQIMPASLSRVVVAYEAGGDLTINEFDRSCAEKLAKAIAAAERQEVVLEGAPGGRRGGNLPSRDQMGRLVNRPGRIEVILDEAGGEITVSKAKRPFGKSRRSLRTNEVRSLELGYDVKGPIETFTVTAIVGPEEEKLAIASYSGFEGWADPVEWREFTQELARTLGVEAHV